MEAVGPLKAQVWHNVPQDSLCYPITLEARSQCPRRFVSPAPRYRKRAVSCHGWSLGLLRCRRSKSGHPGVETPKSADVGVRVQLVPLHSMGKDVLYRTRAGGEKVSWLGVMRGHDA